MEKAKATGFAKVSRYFRDIMGELKRVVWPSKKQIINNTIVVMVFMVVMVILVGLFDLGLSSLISVFFGGKS